MLRILQNKKLETPVKNLYSTYNTLPIPALHKLFIAKLVFNVKFRSAVLPEVYRDYFVANEDIHNYSTRYSSNLHLTVTNNLYGYRCIQQKGCRIWNSIPPDIRLSPSINCFVKTLKSLYLTYQL